MTITQIEKAFAAQINKLLGTQVEITCRTAVDWTVSSDTKGEATKAADWLNANGLLHTREVEDWDDECEHGCVYFITHPDSVSRVAA